MYKILGTKLAVGIYRSPTTPILLVIGPHRQDITQLFKAMAVADQKIAASTKYRETIWNRFTQ